MGTTAGEQLREARFRRGLSLEQVAAATRIRLRYLEALEDDDYSLLPEGVYARGFLRNYADYLGLPASELLELPSRRRWRRVVAPQVQAVARPLRDRRAAGASVAWVILALAILLGGVIAFGTSAPPGDQPEAGGSGVDPERQGTASEVAPLVVLPPLPAAVREPTPTLAAAPAAAATAATRPLRVEVRALDLVWLRATADDAVVFEGFLETGQVRVWTGRQVVHLRIGDAAALDVTVDGQRWGTLGGSRQVVDREWRRG